MSAGIVVLLVLFDTERPLPLDFGSCNDATNANHYCQNSSHTAFQDQEQVPGETHCQHPAA